MRTPDTPRLPRNSLIELAKSASYDGGGPDQVVQPWGIPNSEATRLFFNAGMDLSDSVQLYAFGNYSDSEGDGKAGNVEQGHS